MGVSRIIRNPITADQKAIANGIATLDASAKVPKNQISLTAGDVGAIASESDPTVPTLAKTLASNNAVLAAVNSASGTLSDSLLSSVNGNAGSFGGASQSVSITVDTKGRITAVSNNSISISWTSVSDKPTTLSGLGVTNNDVLSSLNSASGTISADRLPSYVDDFLEFATLANFPSTGESGKIYLAQNTNLSYRWTGSSYVDISSAGTADAATRLTNPRTISTTGDATYSVSFDGSANTSGTMTLASVNSNTGSFGSSSSIPVITVDAKGRITAVSTQSIGNELIAIQALTDPTGFLRKINDAYSIDTTSYLPTTGGTISGNLNLSATTPSTSPTTGASVIAGGQGISGDQHIGGFTSLGGVAGGHPAFKAKLLTGTTASTQGGAALIPHGINNTKIISICALVDYSMTPCFSIVPGYYFDVSYDTTNIVIYNHPTNSGSILSKIITITVLYID